MEQPSEHLIPIYVDMDGTLVNTDIAQELLLQSCKQFSAFRQLLSLASAGASHVKRFVAEQADFDAELLPYNQKLIDYLCLEKEKGRRVILATASDKIIADKVAESVGIFDDVLASEPGRNLKGEKKLEAIQVHSGDNGFEYIGDSSADYPIWQQAQRAGFVNPPKPPKDIVGYKTPVSIHIDDRESQWKPLLKAMRPHQWAKNVLIFLPLFLGHLYFNFTEVKLAIITFFVFSFCASGIYLINDLLDIEADRKHRTKKKRPFAAGKLLPIVGVQASIALILTSVLLSLFFLYTETFIVLVIYIITTNLYSFYLKNYSTIDVITLTILYTIRIIAGSVAIDVELSPWLLNFSLFFFLSLAYMKRYIELTKHSKAGKLAGRNYSAGERDVIMTTGIVNGGISVFTFTMYLNSENVLSHYSSPSVLWLVCPILLFWIYRAWMWTKRDKIDDDPVVFAIKDKISLVTVVLIALIFVLAKYLNLSAIFT